MNTIYTIGYSGFKITDFVEILKKCKISCVIDVRSSPSSKFYPEYNKGIIEKTLKLSGIYYRNYFDEFGARQPNKEYYSEKGYLDFNNFTKSEQFNRGVQKIANGMKQGYKFVLMCAEKDPINCHRNIMVASELYRRGYEIKNIMPNRTIQTQRDIENRLIEMYFPNRNQLSLLEDIPDDKKLVSQAYRSRNADIGYKLEEE